MQRKTFFDTVAFLCMNNRWKCKHIYCTLILFYMFKEVLIREKKKKKVPDVLCLTVSYLRCSRSFWLRVGAKLRTHTYRAERPQQIGWRHCVFVFFFLCVFKDETTWKIMLPICLCPACWEESPTFPTVTDKSDIVYNIKQIFGCAWEDDNSLYKMK